MLQSTCFNIEIALQNSFKILTLKSLYKKEAAAAQLLFYMALLKYYNFTFYYKLKTMNGHSAVYK